VVFLQTPQSDMLQTWLLLRRKNFTAEFPELCGAEQDLIDRTTNEAAAKKFIHLNDRL
jgi:hypothetical protein